MIHPIPRKIKNYNAIAKAFDKGFHCLLLKIRLQGGKKPIRALHATPANQYPVLLLLFRARRGLLIRSSLLTLSIQSRTMDVTRVIVSRKLVAVHRRDPYSHCSVAMEPVVGSITVPGRNRV